MGFIGVVHLFGLVLRGVGTSVIIVPAIAVFLLHGFTIKISTKSPDLRRRRLVRNVQRYSSFALMVMRIKVREEHVFAFTETNTNFLYVCNHMSYLDLMVLASRFPAVFVTSVDMGQVFFLGTMTEIGGSLFVERRNRERLTQDISQLENALADGFSVMLFPEGTSGDGRQVLPFKRSLLNSAAGSGRLIQPLTLHYSRVDGKAFGDANRDVACWYGDKDFVSHFARLLSVKSVETVVTVHEPLYFRQGEDVHAIGDRLHATISQEYSRQLSRSQGGGDHGYSSRRAQFNAHIQGSSGEKADIAQSP